MANIIDYVLWRGDIPVTQVPIGEVDALLLSYLSYMRFDGIVGEAFDGSVPLGDAVRALLAREEKERSSMNFDTKDDERLLLALAGSERFAQMALTGYVTRLNMETEQQFSAVTFLLPDGAAFIAYRGTDESVVGWKEDFNMSFEGEVPSQRTAVDYANYAAGKIARPMILGGHSKGGNLAAYAGMFMSDEARALVRVVYNFDGPGFNETTIASPAFTRVDMRIRTFVPQSSMVGILLWHTEPFTVVKSGSVSVFQHNVYSWQLMGGRFITLSARTSNSHFADETIKRWLSSLQPERRRLVIDGIYAVLSASEGKNVDDLFDARNAMAVLRAAGAMDEETRSAVAEAFRLLGASLIEGVPAWLDRTASDIRLRVTGERREDGAQA